MNSIRETSKVAGLRDAFHTPIESAQGRVVVQTFLREHITEEYLSWLNDKELMKFSNQRFQTHTRETAERYLAALNSTGSLLLMLLEKKTNKPLGTMTVHPNHWHQTCDLGILIGSAEHKGKGFGLEAWRLTADHTMNTGLFRKITAGTNSKNIPMIKIFESYGMVPDGVKHRHEVVEGVETDLVFYAKFRDQ